MLLICSPSQMGALLTNSLGSFRCQRSFSQFQASQELCHVLHSELMLCPSSPSQYQTTTGHSRERLTFASSGTSCDISFLCQGSSVFIQAPTCTAFVADVPMQTTTLAPWSDLWQSLCKVGGSAPRRTGNSWQDKVWLFQGSHRFVVQVKE